jgi:Mrr N-terminal domain
MANRAVVIPTFDQLMNPTLAALHALGGSAAIPELVERVIADLRCPREVVEQPHGDRGLTELEYRLAWARTYLKKYGLLDNSSRAIWSLTPKGLETKVLDDASRNRVCMQHDYWGRGDQSPRGEDSLGSESHDNRHILPSHFRENVL